MVIPLVRQIELIAYANNYGRYWLQSLFAASDNYPSWERYRKRFKKACLALQKFLHDHKFKLSADRFEHRDFSS
ncbi:hypothetical protein BOO25_08715 [Vibrio navarrensis]|nr:hypothetical protein [Vibrio navarrensis]